MSNSDGPGRDLSAPRFGLDDERSPLHGPQLMLMALRCVAREVGNPADCLPVLKGRLGDLRKDLPDDRTLRENLALAYQELAMAALVDPTGDGRFAITPRGTALLETHPTGIDGSVLEDYPEYRDYISAMARPKSPPAGVDDDGVVHEPEPPYLEGVTAFQRGFDLNDNPYAADSAAHQEWSNGWSSAAEKAARSGGTPATRSRRPR